MVIESVLVKFFWTRHHLPLHVSLLAVPQEDALTREGLSTLLADLSVSQVLVDVNLQA